MPFLVRRGTNNQRLTVTPAQGEIIYTTDTKNLFVGDGTTLGGNLITGTFAGGTLSSNLNTSTFLITNSTNLTINGGNGAVTGTSITATTGFIGSYYLGSNSINTSTGSISINGATGTVTANSFVWPNTYTDSYGSIQKGSFPQVVQSTNSRVIDAVGFIAGGANGLPGPSVYSSVSRGYVGSIASVQAGDTLGGFLISGYIGSSISRFDVFAGITAAIDASATVGEVSPNFGTGNTNLTLFTITNTGAVKTATLDYKGVLTSQGFASSGYNGSNYPASPTAGTIIFDTTSLHFYGYNGSAWKQLDN
jgi:hypothetical protein